MRVGDEVEKLKYSYFVGKKCKMIQLLWKTIWWFIKMLNIKIPYDKEIPFLDICPKDLKEGVQTKFAHECLCQHYSQ